MTTVRRACWRPRAAGRRRGSPACGSGSSRVRSGWGRALRRGMGRLLEAVLAQGVTNLTALNQPGFAALEKSPPESGSPALLMTPAARVPAASPPQLLRQAALSTRARRSTNPARPYICRLIVFRPVHMPLHGAVAPPLRHRRLHGTPRHDGCPRRTAAGPGPTRPHLGPATRSRSRSTAYGSGRRTRPPGPAPRPARRCSRGWRRAAPVREACVSPVGGPTRRRAASPTAASGPAESAALRRSRFFPAAPSRFVTNA